MEPSHVLGDRYRVVRRVGRGGMATVYLAEDLKHRRPVAIKVFDQELARLLGPERFVREIEIAAKLQHPNILPLLDSGTAGDLLYYVMPYVEGESLRQRLQAERQLGYDEARRLATDVARALDYAHRQGIVHRDIKPENILLADGQAMVADFGIARALSASGGEKLTGTGMVLGSPPYMSPEQIAGRADVDGRSDLYSLGCTLYEMLAGQPPFTGPPETLAHQHLHLAPRPIRDLRPTASPGLDATLMRLLAKVPAERFESGAVLAAALAGASVVPAREHGDTAPASVPSSETAATLATRRIPLDRPVPAPDPSPPSRPRGLWVGVALAVIVLVIAAALLWRSGWIGPGAGGPPGTERRWVWVASFAANGGEVVTATAVQELVAAALDQSKVVSTVPIEQVKIALRNAGRSDTTTIPAELARELAYRSSIPVVIDGKVTRIGTTTTLALRATSSEDGHVFASVTGSAATDRELVPVVTRLTRELRRGLGESSRVFTRTDPWTDAPTPSFEAFKLFLQGRDLINGNDPFAAIPVLRRAAALDPEFATAWLGIGIAFSNMGRLDSTQAYMRLALSHPDRLTPSRRLTAEAQLAEASGDIPGAIQAYDELLHLDVTPAERSSAMNNKAGLLIGMPEQAYELYRQSVALEPVAAPDIAVSNMAQVLIEMRRIPEAREMARKIRGPIGPVVQTELLLIERSWDRADSLVNAIQRDPGLPPLIKRRVRGAGASVLGARGRITEADRVLEELGRLASTDGFVNGASAVWFTRSWLARLAGRAAPPEPKAMKGSSWSRAATALRLAEAGDSSGARAAVERWPDPLEADEASHQALRDHVEGLLALRRGRWNVAVVHLRENARTDIRTFPTLGNSLRTRSRWLIADAFDRLGQPDSVAAYLQLILEPPANGSTFQRGLWEPFVRSRLVGVYASMGRVEEAQREWDALVTTCTLPDPDLRAALDGTRGVLQAARARVRSR